MSYLCASRSRGRLKGQASIQHLKIGLNVCDDVVGKAQCFGSQLSFLLRENKKIMNPTVLRLLDAVNLYPVDQTGEIHKSSQDKVLYYKPISVRMGMFRVCQGTPGYQYTSDYLYRILLEKLTVPQLVKKFSAFYGTRMFITVFTTARHLSLF
jgi:hypothetical protein